MTRLLVLFWALLLPALLVVAVLTEGRHAPDCDTTGAWWECER